MSFKPIKPFIGRDQAALLLLLFLSLEFFSPVLFGDKTFFFRDIPMAAYPLKHFLSTAYREGFWPFWNPSLFGGTPFMATLHTGVFYPPSLIFFLDDFTTAFNLYFVLHHMCLTFSVYALARYWKLSVGAALCSAVTAFWGGYFLTLMNIYNHFQSVVWVPLIFLFFQKYLEKGNTRHFMGTVACLTCQTLAGSPENSVMTVLLLYAYSIFLVPGATRIAGISRRTLILAGVVVLTLGLTAAQLLPTHALVNESVRSEGLIFADHAKWSLQPGLLATLFVPIDFTGFMEWRQPMAVSFIQSIYMGIFPAVFLCLGFLFLKEKAIRFWIAVFSVGIFFALGKYNPLYEFLYQWIPFLKMFQYPEKFYFFSAFSLVFLVGHCLDAVMRSVSERTLKLPAFLGVLLLVCVMIGLMAQWVPKSDVFLAIGFLFLFGFGFLMLYFKKLGALAFKSILLLLMLSDLTWKHYMLAPMIDREFFKEEPRLTREVKKEGELYRVYSGAVDGEISAGAFAHGPNLLLSHIFTKQYLRPNLGMIYGIAYAEGMSGVELNDISLWATVFQNSPPERRRRILKRSNVKYWVPPVENSIDPNPAQPRVEVLAGALPRAFLVPMARIGKDPQLLNIYYDESFDPYSEVLVSEPVSWEKNEHFAGAVDEIKYDPNRVRIRSHQNGDGFLVLMESWFPGWKVSVDGRPGRILRGNHFYQTVQLEAGEHIIEFSFEPEGFKTGVAVSLGTLLIILTGGLWHASRGRNRLA